jgi:hypothetical protein
MVTFGHAFKANFWYILLSTYYYFNIHEINYRLNELSLRLVLYTLCCTCLPLYLGWSSDIDISFSETAATNRCWSLISTLLELHEAAFGPSSEAAAVKPELKAKAGLDGARLSSEVEVGLLSMSTTAEASGRSAGFSWTHRSPTSMQLRTSPSGYPDSASSGSTTSVVEPVLHLSQTCTEHWFHIWYMEHGKKIILSNIVHLHDSAQTRSLFQSRMHCCSFAQSPSQGL